MGAQIAEEQAQKKGHPLVSGAHTRHAAGNVGVFAYITVGICVVDDNVRLFGMLDLFYLTAAVRADHGGFGNPFPTVLTKLCARLCCRGSFNAVGLHSYFSLSFVMTYNGEESFCHMCETGTFLLINIQLYLLFVKRNRNYNSYNE